METHKIRILIVDDQLHVRKGLQALLESNDLFEVIGFATNGIQAIDVALSEVPDVILMDAHMPYLDGFETSRHLRKNHLSSGIILMDTVDDPHFEQRAAVNGVQSYIIKSKPEVDLIEKIIKIAHRNQTIH